MSSKENRAELIEFGLLVAKGSNFYKEKEYIEIMADRFLKHKEELRIHHNKYIRDFELSRYNNRDTK